MLEGSNRSNAPDMAACSDTVTEPTIPDEGSQKQFIDVHPVNHWATEAISFVVNRGI